MAGYAKIKLINQQTLPPQGVTDLLTALGVAEGVAGVAAAPDRLCGGIGYLGCVVVRFSDCLLLLLLTCTWLL